MSRFPKIDSPCPLSKQEQASLDGHCGRCGKTVHCLDGMGDAGRQDFLRKAKGPVCVSYRLPVALSATLALTVAIPALAADASPPKDRCPVPAEANATASALPPDATGDRLQLAPAQASAASKSVDHVVVLVGGVHDPADAQWVEDTSLPELPTAVDDTNAK